MELILVRHGNTFGKNDPVVWVGSKQDMPLTDFAKEQASRVAEALHKMNKTPTAIYSGTLQRLTVFSSMILDALFLRLKLKIDARLNEIDYGLWGGKTRDEICAQFGKETLDDWEKHLKWPESAEWGESEAQVLGRIHQAANDFALHHQDNEVVLAVSSNGCLRYFLDLVPGELQRRIALNAVKVATGHFCCLTHNGKAWSVKAWNQDPCAC